MKRTNKNIQETVTADLYNIAYEKAILASIIFDPRIFSEIENTLSDTDFYLVAHQDIYRAIMSLSRKDMPIDEEFIKDSLGAKFNEKVLVEVLISSPIANITAYVNAIKNNSELRKYVQLSSDIKRAALEDGNNSEDVSELIEKKMLEISSENHIKGFKDSATVASDARAFIKEMKAKGNNVLVGVDTGYVELNRMTTGFGKGDLVIIAARPAMGKTSFALNMVQNLLNKGKGVAFFSLEMPAEQLMLRMLSLTTSIPLQRIRVGDFSGDEAQRLDDAMISIERSKLFIDDSGGINIHQLRSKLRKLKTKHPEIELAVIDYLQIMNGTGGKDRHLEVSEISRGLKMLARELGIPIVALSQLNRGLESRADKRPMLSDIRESGSIEQDADIILFVYRNDVYLYKEEKEREKAALSAGKEFISKFIEKEEEEAEIIIGKQRNGPTGHVKLMFQKKFTRFTDRPTFGAVQVVYETKQMSDNVSMPII